MNILYLVHNTRDPAVERRTRMLLAGGAAPVVAGFRRAAKPPESVAGVSVIDLGQSYDARLIQRIALTLNAFLKIGGLREQARKADAIIARNLETLFLAVRARGFEARSTPIVYECLDIHRLMLGSGMASKVMRALERSLLSRCSLVIVSSPAFLDQYFRPVQHLAAPTLLVENKVLALTSDGGSPDSAGAPRPEGPPWRIGWYGMIRCRRSFEILKQLAASRPGQVEVEIRGLPTSAVFPDFDREVAEAPGVTFGGAYRPDQLAELYSRVHFTWAIDFYEEGQNSSWLLPNRLYEGPAHGAVPIALRSVETGRWLAARNAGVLLDSAEEIDNVISGMSAEIHAGLFRDLKRIPEHDLYTTAQDCFALVSTLGELQRVAAMKKA